MNQASEGPEAKITLSLRESMAEKTRKHLIKWWDMPSGTWAFLKLLMGFSSNSRRGKTRKWGGRETFPHLVWNVGLIQLDEDTKISRAFSLSPPVPLNMLFSLSSMPILFPKTISFSFFRLRVGIYPSKKTSWIPKPGLRPLSWGVINSLCFAPQCSLVVLLPI